LLLLAALAVSLSGCEAAKEALFGADAGADASDSGEAVPDGFGGFSQDGQGGGGADGEGGGTGASDTDDPADTTPEPDAEPGDVATPPEDTGAPDATPDVGPTEPASGGVYIAQSDADEFPLAAVGALYTTEDSGGATIIGEYGACRVVTGGANPLDPTTLPPGIDGGPASISGLAQPVQLTPVPQAGGAVTYSSGLSTELETIYGAGSVTITSSGSAWVPAWSLTLPTPAEVTITAPEGGLFETIEKDSDLQVTWTPANGTNTEVSVVVTEGTDVKPGNRIECSIAGDPGAFTIPKAAMGMLPGGGFLSSDFAVVVVSRIVAAEADLGSYDGEVGAILARSSLVFASLQ
jgi:hypothetical protein